jgi:peptidoglycan/xylan/chitin deacetylase (PgdA/CDA1 family)
VILFLTYHKVCAGIETGVREFYTVTRDQLMDHFQALADTGRRCVPVSALRDHAALPPDNFILSFDDGTSDHFELVLPLLRERGWSATFFVPTGKLNKPGYLTDGQVRELARAGHSIGCHSHEHRRLDLATDDQMREQLSRSQQILGNLVGGKPWLFAPVGGFMNEHVREVALGFGVEVIRTMRWGYNKIPDLTALETIPINGHTDSGKFQKILEARQTPYLYYGKQAMKALVPSRAYEKLRTLLFKLAGRN